MGQPQPLFVYFHSRKQKFYWKIEDFSGVRTWFVRVEGEPADHMTTTKARHLLSAALKSCHNLRRHQIWQKYSAQSSLFIRGAVWPDRAIFCTLGNHSKHLATIILPKSPTILVNFCKGVKIIHFLVKSFLGNFYRNLAIFIWSHWRGARYLLACEITSPFNKCYSRSYNKLNFKIL